MMLNRCLVCSTLVTEVNTSVTPDPRIVSQMNSTVPPQSPVASTSTDTQATLLALLTQAASHQVP
jgi:protein NRD1